VVVGRERERERERERGSPFPSDQGTHPIHEVSTLVAQLPPKDPHLRGTQHMDVGKTQIFSPLQLNNKWA
jgi:hypothetical protein